MFKKQRRRYLTYPFVDRRFQFNVGLLLALVGFVNAVVFSLVLFLYSRESFFHVVNYLPEPFLGPELLEQQLRMWLKVIVFFAVPEALLLLLLGLFFSHRVIGPVHGVSLRLRKVAKGQVPEPIYGRQDYFLEHLVKEMNEAITKLQATHAELKELSQSAKDGNLEEVRIRLERLTAEADSTPPPGEA